MNEIEQAKQLLKEEARDSVMDAANGLETMGDAEWVLDPEVAGVVGLVKPGTRTAFIVVYLNDRDFETSDDFDQFEASL